MCANLERFDCLVVAEEFSTGCLGWWMGKEGMVLHVAVSENLEVEGRPR